MAEPQKKPRNRIGRPFVLTPDVQRKILDYVAEGNFLTDSVLAAGISYHCFFHWQKRWRECDPEADKYDGFFESLKNAQALANVNALRNLREGGLGWQAQAWFLERRFHKQWGKKDTVYVKGGGSKAGGWDLGSLTDEELEDLAKQTRKKRRD